MLHGSHELSLEVGHIGNRYLYHMKNDQGRRDQVVTADSQMGKAERAKKNLLRRIPTRRIRGGSEEGLADVCSCYIVMACGTNLFSALVLLRYNKCCIIARYNVWDHTFNHMHINSIMNSITGIVKRATTDTCRRGIYTVLNHPTDGSIHFDIHDNGIVEVGLDLEQNHVIDQLRMKVGEVPITSGLQCTLNQSTSGMTSTS